MERVMTRSEVEAIIRRHQESFSQRSVDRLASDHTLDGTFHSPAAGIVEGREAIRKVYAYWFEAFPDLAMTWDAPLVDGTRAAIFWHFSGTLAGEFFGGFRPGTRVEFTGAAELQVVPEGIVSIRHLFDFTGALIAAGVLKVKPS
jgi:predicted ester cyclase